MISVNRQSWHVKVYLWWYGHKYGYQNRNGFSNLCPYMRAVMFWAPVRAMLWNWLEVGPRQIPLCFYTYLSVLLSSAALFTHSHRLHKVGMIMWMVYGAIVMAGIVVALMLKLAEYLSHIKFMTKFADWLDKHLSPPLSAVHVKVFKPIMAATRVKHSEFLELVGEYLHSMHDRVCPEVHFE